jgi:hypothetical protein
MRLRLAAYRSRSWISEGVANDAEQAKRPEEEAAFQRACKNCERERAELDL